MISSKLNVYYCLVFVFLSLSLFGNGVPASTAAVSPEGFWKAVAQGRQARVRKALMQHPRLLGSRTSDGKTALQLAIENHHLGVVRELLRLGADPDQSAQGNLRPVHFAVIQRQLHVLHWLLREGVTLEARDIHGTTALMYAVRQDDERLATTLLRAGAAVDGLEPGNWSPLMQAAFQGSRRMAQLLLYYGAFRERVSVYGLTAAKAAEQKGFLQLARLLRPE